MKYGLSRKALGLWMLFLVLALAAALLPPIPQPLSYHRFADNSHCLGISHCFDTLSNLLFVLAGVSGLGFLATWQGRGVFLDQRERLPYLLFFCAVGLVGLASAYYHLAPGNGRLTWDRLAVALALMSWLAAILCERVDVRRGRHLLPLLILAGLGSAGYWGWSESIGRGDLRPYALMQLVPFVIVPMLLRLYPARYDSDRDILAVLGFYFLALLCDFLDRPVAALTGFVSGHTLKHILAAAGAGWVLVSLARRRPAGSGG